MKNLLYALAALLVILLSAPCMPTAVGQQTTGGAYTTYLNGQPFGTETYTVTAQADGTRTTLSDATFSSLKLRATTIYAADNKPRSYTLDVNGARAVSVDFTPQGAKVNVDGQATKQLTSRVDAIFENGAWDQFIFLLAQYDAARGGAQVFNCLVPAQALEFTLAVERTGAPSFDVKGQKVATEQYRLVTGIGLTFDVWTDAARTPVLISLPSQRLRIVRGGSEDLAAAILPMEAPKPTPTPSANDPFTSEDVTFQNGELKLAGTLTIPKAGTAPHPAAVLISGSGTQDRDGNGLGLIYKKIAERLSANGVAVLRVDDRGAGRSAMPSKPTSYRDLVADTRAAFEYVLTRKEVDPKRVALVGHSEGATTALLIAADDPRVAAIASLAGISRPLDSVLFEQTLYMMALQGTVDPSDRSKMPGLVRNLMEVFEEAKKTPAGAQADRLTWFREHAAADLMGAAKRLRVPLLVLNGERDENVMPYHAIELARAAVDGGNKQVRLRIFPNLSHLFAPSHLDKAVPAEKYTEVSDEFLQTLQVWASETLRAGK